MPKRPLLVLLLAGLVWANNTSLFHEGGEEPFFVAHRAAAPVFDPEHEDPRAKYVEIDVRLTKDSQLAVFHDPVLNCKTEAEGRLVDFPMDDLRSLDAGYGYYTEAGEYPLRGKGVALIPSLGDVLDTFPTQGIVIDLKDGTTQAALVLGGLLRERSLEDRSRLWILGLDRAVTSLQEIQPDLKVVSRRSVRKCWGEYMALGWTGYVPTSCRGTVVGAYSNLGWLWWGWPHLFVKRMESVGTEVLVTHPYQRRSAHDLPETQEYAAQIPRGYSGGVETNRIDKIRDWREPSGRE